MKKFVWLMLALALLLLIAVGVGVVVMFFKPELKPVDPSYLAHCVACAPPQWEGACGVDCSEPEQQCQAYGYACDYAGQTISCGSSNYCCNCYRGGELSYRNGRIECQAYQACHESIWDYDPVWIVEPDLVRSRTIPDPEKEPERYQDYINGKNDFARDGLWEGPLGEGSFWEKHEVISHTNPDGSPKTELTPFGELPLGHIRFTVLFGQECFK